jgi:hypothetical protein
MRCKGGGGVNLLSKTVITRKVRALRAKWLKHAYSMFKQRARGLSSCAAGGRAHFAVAGPCTAPWSEGCAAGRSRTLASRPSQLTVRTPRASGPGWGCAWTGRDSCCCPWLRRVLI